MVIGADNCADDSANGATDSKRTLHHRLVGMETLSPIAKEISQTDRRKITTTVGEGNTSAQTAEKRKQQPRPPQ